MLPRCSPLTASTSAPSAWAGRCRPASIPQPLAQHRHGRDPGGHVDAMAVGRDGPGEEGAGFLDGVGQRQRQRHDQHHDDHQQRQRGRQRGASAAARHQALVDRPAGQADDQRRQCGHQETAEEIRSRQQYEQQKPTGDQVCGKNRLHVCVSTEKALRALTVGLYRRFTSCDGREACNCYGFPRKRGRADAKASGTKSRAARRDGGRP